MNARLVIRYIGFFVLAVSAALLTPVPWAFWFTEWPTLMAFMLSSALGASIGLLCLLIGRHASDVFTHREGLGLVSLSWLAVAAVGAFPYVMAGALNPVDAYFESMSGFTTTGSTVIQDIEATPKSLLFWRALTQWLGGMGIVVLFIAVLPYLGAGGKLLFRSESPGPDPRALTPHIKDTATALYRIYLSLTAIQTAALMLAGMPFYDALVHTFTTLPTGGFSTKQASIAAYDSVAIEIIIMVFMIIAGTNFALFFAIMRGDWKAPFRSTEWRVYLAILAVVTGIVMVDLLLGEFNTAGGEPTGGGYTVGGALRSASFQTISIMTTTGYGTDDFDTWPHFARMLIVALMFVGGCAGSTAGGIKVSRIIILLKIMYWRIESTFRPKTVRAVRIGEEVIDREVQNTVTGFIILYVLWLSAGVLFMSALGLNYETATSSVVSALNNIGPGLDAVGATRDYSQVPAVGKIFLSLCMVLGRLELYSVTVLLMPSFWKHS